MPAWLRAPLAAVTFLTVVPIGRRVALDGTDVARSTPFLPLVGALLGAVVGTSTWGLAQVAPPLVAAALGVALAAALTGALHLDGLADTVDGFGARTREDALRIMRDHNVGAYGAVALILDLVIKVAAVAPIAGRPGAIAVWAVAGALSRGSAPLLSAALPYVQRAGGSGSVLSGTGAGYRAVAGGVLALVLAAAVLGLDAWAPVVVAVVVVLGCGRLARRRLGGVTGDVLGAGTEMTETAVLVAAVSVIV